MPEVHLSIGFISLGLFLRNYIYERDFREKVLDFLYDGELKLFKSP